MLQLAVIFFGLSQIVLILILLARAGRKRPAEWVFALLILCVAADLLLQLSRSLAPVYINWLLSFFRTAVPGMFWLLCCALFDDHFCLKTWKMALVFMMSFLPLCASVYGAFDTPPDLLLTLLVKLPQVLELVLVGHGLSIIARYWKVDLIPLRRSFGQSLILFSGMFICLIISTRYVFNMYSPWMADAQYILLSLFLLYFNAQLLVWQKLPLFGYSPDDNDLTQRVSDNPSTTTLDSAKEDDDESAQKQVLQLRQLMEEQKIYRKNGLTISEVAKQMLMPEYRLRLLINGELGYRNFSDFIVRYRIEEATQLLADPSEKRLPVLSIALSVGYRSLSSFNKSFKEIHQLTPSEYRRKQLG